MLKQVSLLEKVLLLIVLICSSFTLSAADKGITIDVKDATPSEVFRIIESQSGYRISYRTQLVDKRHDITIKKTDASVESVLDAALSGRDLSYRIVSPKSIVIVEKNAESAAGVTAGHKRKISGHITGPDNEPVIGASVTVPGTKINTISDIDGNWTLNVPEDAGDVLISYVGCVPQRLKLDGRNSFETVLAEDAQQLDAVVVVGYGVQKKSVVTAAISSVKSDQLKAMTPTRMDNVLKGMVSGVSITSSSGQPGDGNRIRIRGTGTINDSNPLYIVDGAPVNGGIEYINPADIESVEVLKDAASAAIYGSRGANGVILVTTKRGTEGKTTVSYDFSYGIQNPWKKKEMLNATEYATLMNEMRMNDGMAPLYDDPSVFGTGTNWQDEVFDKNSPIINHQLGISGGNSRINYYVSASYLYQEGIVGGSKNHSNYERFTVRNNNNYTLFDVKEQRTWLRSLRMGTNIAYSHEKSRGISNNSERGSVLGSALSMTPTLSVYATNPEETIARYPHAVVDGSGRPFTIPGVEFASMPNPMALLYMPCDVNKTDRIVGSAFAELELYTNLKFKSSISADLSIYQNDGFSLPYYLNSTRQSDTSETWSTMTKGWSWQVENTLAYTLDVAEKHHFNFLVGQSASMAGDQYVSGTSYLIRDPSQPWLDATDQDTKLRSASGAPSPQSRLASYFGRVGYNFDERYLFEFTIRRDGSSKFSPENKWANFPSVSAGWNITNEPFMENRPQWLTYMKLRASWGKNGNQNIRSFAYTSMMNGGANYIFGIGGTQAIVPGIVPGSYSNAGLKWEESEQTDVGLDLRFFNNSLAVTLDYYNKRTNGMLMEMALPGYIGNTRPLGNVGDMKNEGFEFDVTYTKRFGEVNFRAGVNGSYNKNQVVKLGNETGSLNYDAVLGTLGTISRAENGEPFPFFYGWKTAGIFQTTSDVMAHVNSKGELLQPDAVAGDVIFVDTNNDGVIDDADRCKLGKGMPDWTFGLSLGLEWRGIDFNMLLHATVGNDIYDATRRADYPQVNMPRYMLDRWCGPGSSNELPRLTSKAGGNQNWRSSDLFVHDGSFLRCRSMQLGYTLPQNLTRKFFVNKLRVYVGAENLFTLTRYHGFDPEISSGGTSLGIDKGVYPQARTFLFGLNVTF